MKFISPIFAQASGSLSGTTFSHNKGGQYVRNRSTPINPASTAQTAVRNALKTLTTRWTNTLTQAERDTWKTYAVNVPIINKIGQSRVIPELAMYLRCNSPRLINGSIATVIDAGPTIFSLATFTAPALTTTPVFGLSVAYDNTDDWAIADGGFLYFYVSRPQNTAIQFFKGPYRFAGAVAGDTMTPPTSPAAMTSPFAFAAGQQVFWRANVSNADGRLSSSISGSVLT